VKEGGVKIMGAYFNVETGKVTMMGQHPSAARLMEVEPKKEIVRLAAAPAVPAEEAFAQMVAGNARYASGHHGMLKTNDEDLMRALSEGGQNPISIILGCSDSRAPAETIFDVRPGDLFICRNAGNTVMAARGSVIGSMEYSVANLKTKCLIVLGHHKCGAITAAVQTVKGVATMRENGTYDLSSIDLEAVPVSIGDVLRDILDASCEAVEEIPNGTQDEQVTLGVTKNVIYTMEKVIKFSPIIRDGIIAGDVKVYGGVYDIIKANINWLGQHPDQDKILAQFGAELPMFKWSTTPYVSPAKPVLPTSSGAVSAMQKLMEGNGRFASGTSKGGDIAKEADISEVDPYAIVVGGAEVNVPIEKIFDATPGELIVQRSMSNVAGREGGILFHSLEYAVQKWSPKLLLVMGESHCPTVNDAFDQLSGSTPPSTAQSAILSKVMVSAWRAHEQIEANPEGSSAGRENHKKALAVELNALYTIERLLHSPTIAKAVKEEGLEVHAAVLDCTTGKVRVVGPHPMQEGIIGPLNAAPQLG